MSIGLSEIIHFFQVINQTKNAFNFMHSSPYPHPSSSIYKSIKKKKRLLERDLIYPIHFQYHFLNMDENYLFNGF